MYKKQVLILLFFGVNTVLGHKDECGFCFKNHILAKCDYKTKEKLWRFEEENCEKQWRDSLPKKNESKSPTAPLKEQIKKIKEITKK